MPNHLKDQTSPYLLQHAENPVDWYPWCQEAFARAEAEDKPVFLSVGYSTCHWCHVMAHESFEDETIAALLNRYFVAVKVDKEERPDIDSIYMSVCQAFTGSGGWPMSVFLTPDQKPFFAGTYFPKTAAYGRIGLKELLTEVHEKWETNREGLLRSADEIVSALSKDASAKGKSQEGLIGKAVAELKESYDERFGGFGDAPKFPTPHKLLFLLRYYEKNKDQAALEIAENTLQKMYRGGIFDHIGGGFCRCSTDRYFLVPHFEKMLYDNALLISAYCKAYQVTKKQIYRDVAEAAAEFVLREMTSGDGGFYSAMDADCEGAEGKYYLFEPSAACRTPVAALIVAVLFFVLPGAVWFYLALTDAPVNAFTERIWHILLCTPMYACMNGAVREMLSTEASLLRAAAVLVVSVPSLYLAGRLFRSYQAG